MDSGQHERAFVRATPPSAIKTTVCLDQVQADGKTPLVQLTPHHFTRGRRRRTLFGLVTFSTFRSTFLRKLLVTTRRKEKEEEETKGKKEEDKKEKEEEKEEKEEEKEKKEEEKEEKEKEKVE